MKQITWALVCCLLVSCASIKKTSTKTVKFTDSLTVVTKDTASKTIAIVKNRDVEIQDFTFHVQYANGDTVTRVIKKVSRPATAPGNPIDNEIAQALASFNIDHSQIVSIDGHIGNIRELVDYSSKTDSHGVKTSGIVQIKHSDTSVVKTVSKLRVPVGIIIAGSVIVLLIVGVWLFKHGIL